MQEQILELLNENNNSYTEVEISKKLNLNLTEVCENLRKLETEGKIHFTKKSKYIGIKHTNLKIGRLEIKNSGNGYVVLENEADIKIMEKDLNGAIHNDIVAVDDDKIVKVVERNLKNFIGDFVSINNKNFVVINSKYKLEIVIENSERQDAVDGSKVIVEPYEKIKDNQYKGKILKVIGHKNDPKTDILAIIYENEIEKNFSEEAKDEIKGISFEIEEKDILKRRDLRAKTIFTIDGDDAKDFDDALSVEKLSNGNFLVGVHIADVTHYVIEDGKLDKEAISRATSVYLANAVIPMLPTKLSNDICSLNPNVDRFCLSLDVELDNNANIVNYDIYESVINSKKRMTYNEVNKILVDKQMVEGYENFVNELETLKQISQKIRKQRKDRGNLELEIPEIKFIVDENEDPIDVVLRKSSSGEKLIEDFMVLANETIAEHFFHLDLPFVYRVHEKPEPEKITKFLMLLKSLGHKTNIKLKSMTSKDLQITLESIKEDTAYPILSEFAIRSTKKAVYKTENLGHFGLASKFYCHFTSPIRRIADYSIHRVIKNYINGKDLNADKLKIIKEKLIYVSEKASYKERKAMECERAVNDMLSAKYMSKKIGEEYEGVISGIIPSGIFVRLENFIEGRISLDSLDDYYIFYEESMSLKGKRTNKTYKLGDIVNVKVVDASKEERTIDFEIVKFKK